MDLGVIYTYVLRDSALPIVTTCVSSDAVTVMYLLKNVIKIGSADTM